jgi:hypothetical protein
LDDENKGPGSLQSPFTCIVDISGAAFNLAMNDKPTSTYSKTALNPQVIFDAALADLNEEPRLGHPSASVLHRARPLRACIESTRLRRERALNEAAEALARLWKR